MIAVQKRGDAIKSLHASRHWSVERRWSHLRHLKQCGDDMLASFTSMTLSPDPSERRVDSLLQNWQNSSEFFHSNDRNEVRRQAGEDHFLRRVSEISSKSSFWSGNFVTRQRLHWRTYSTTSFVWLFTWVSTTGAADLAGKYTVPSIIRPKSIFL